MVPSVKKPAVRILHAAMNLAMGVAVVEAMQRWLAMPNLHDALHDLSPVFLVLGIAVAYLLAIAVHEARHFVVGRLTGIRFSLVGIGPSRSLLHRRVGACAICGGRRSEARASPKLS